jgi:hypothetical protein
MRSIVIALVAGIIVAGFGQPPLITAENFKENSCASIYTFATSNIPGESAEDRAKFLQWCNEDRVLCEPYREGIFIATSTPFPGLTCGGE